MDSKRFDELAARLVVPLSRRGFGLLGLLGFDRVLTSHEAIGKKRKKKKKSKNKNKNKNQDQGSPPTAASCSSCANPTPVCVNNTCVACTSSTQCPARTICDGGSCQPCTVCASGCLYPTLTSALADPVTEIRLCAGTYDVNLTLQRDITLIGAGNGTGPDDTILNGGNTGRVIEASGDFAIGLRNVRITGGVATGSGETDAGRGGGIWASTRLTLSDCIITGNTAQLGGGIHNIGEAQLTRCTVSDNEVVDDGLLGGGISNSGTLTLTQSRVTRNRAWDGGGIYTDRGIVSLNDSVVDTNTAVGAGGGIFADSSHVHLLNGSRIAGNHADPEGSSGAGLFLVDTLLQISGGSSITGNDPEDCFDGGVGQCP